MIGITGAAGGSYRLRFQYDANHNNTIDTGEDVTSGAISATATAADVEAAVGDRVSRRDALDEADDDDDDEDHEDDDEDVGLVDPTRR